MRSIWYPSTVATLSREAKKVIKAGLEQTSEDVEGQLPFKLHDFGARGATCSEAAMLGGMGHLINFMGTDTIEAIIGAQELYNEPMAGYSIPASEHSTMTSWLKSGEKEAYKNLLDQYPTGLVACVSDSYDIMNACNEIWGTELKDKVLQREGTLVVRPDSGEATQIPIDVCNALMDKFGYTVNSKGYKVLPDQVRVIQGDGMNLQSLSTLIDNITEAGISLDNFAFGMGGGLLQKVDRDTMKYAMKCSHITIDGDSRDVFKDPITDQGKRSKKGVLALIKEGGEYKTIRYNELHGRENLLKMVFRNGEITKETDFSKIRENAKL